MADMLQSVGPALAIAITGYLIFRLIRLIRDGRRQMALMEARRLRELRTRGA
jgi:hypothetical protein